MAKGHGVDLLRGEVVDSVARPHPLSFLRYHLFAVYLIGVALFLRWLHSYLNTSEPIREVLSSLDTVIGMTGLPGADMILLILFWVNLLLSGFFVAGLWASRMPLVYLVLVGVAGTVMEVSFPAGYQAILVEKPIAKLWLLVTTSVVGIALAEVYRRGHVYIITNHRIIARRALIKKEERELTYDKISDVHVDQGILGRIFNFGTVVSLTSWGTGLPAERIAQRTGGATHLSLCGIRDAAKVRVMVANRQLAAEEASVTGRTEKPLREEER